MGKGIFNLFGVMNRSSFDTVHSYSQTFHMPYVTPSPPVNSSFQKTNYILHMRPLYDSAMLDVIRFYRWPKIYYIYDTDEGEHFILYHKHYINLTLPIVL